MASNTDTSSSQDINECEDNNGGCEMLCMNYYGSYSCGCVPPKILEMDKKTCACKFTVYHVVNIKQDMKCFEIFKLDQDSECDKFSERF